MSTIPAIVIFVAANAGSYAVNLQSVSHNNDDILVAAKERKEKPENITLECSYDYALGNLKGSRTEKFTFFLSDNIMYNVERKEYNRIVGSNPSKIILSERRGSEEMYTHEINRLNGEYITTIVDGDSRLWERGKCHQIDLIVPPKPKF